MVMDIMGKQKGELMKKINKVDEDIRWQMTIPGVVGIKLQSDQEPKFRSFKDFMIEVDKIMC